MHFLEKKKHKESMLTFPQKRAFGVSSFAMETFFCEKSVQFKLRYSVGNARSLPAFFSKYANTYALCFFVGNEHFFLARMHRPQPSPLFLPSASTKNGAPNLKFPFKFPAKTEGKISRPMQDPDLNWRL